MKQYCIFGIKLENCRYILSLAIYEKQPKYDTTTGKQTHTESILVKKEESIYKWLNYEGKYLWDLAEKIAKETNMFTLADTTKECIYVGRQIGESLDCGRFELLEGTLDVPDRTIFHGQEWRIHFVALIG